MKRCFFVLLWFVSAEVNVQANSYLYQPLVPPKAGDIVAFTNGLAPPIGTRQPATRGQILRFLRNGKSNLDVESWYSLEYPQRRAIDNCDGVMVDCRGNFFFWFLRSPKTLKLETADGRTALLQLP